MNANKSFVIALALILALIRFSNGAAITKSSQQKIILDKHNEVRRLAANGQISQHGFGTAAKMYPLTWDNTLADKAERLASTCSFNHDSDGQNIAWGAGGYTTPGVGVPNENPQGTPDGCINCFSSEDEAIKFLQYGWISSEKGDEQRKGPNGLSHFTQMVDDDTFKVGCALNLCGTQYYLVCNYDPAGNLVGSPAYETGNTASKCPNGNNNGLCSGTPQQSGSGSSGSGSDGGSSGGSTDLPWINDPTAELNRFCNGNGSQSGEGGSNGVCVYTVTCNDGRSKQFRGSC